MKNTLRRFSVAGAVVAAFASFSVVNAGAAQAAGYEKIGSYTEEDCYIVGNRGRAEEDWSAWYCEPSPFLWVWDLYAQR